MVKVVQEILKELVGTLPLSLMVKLSDGKLSSQEILELTREISTVVFKVLHEHYADKDADDADQVTIEDVFNK